MADDTTTETAPTRNFLQTIIEEHLAEGRYGQRVATRFPPEPNGYLHIGHAKSICLNFGLGKRYNGQTHLRFDDTNPTKEETEYVESIKADVRWLGFDWGEHLYFASDYFERMYSIAQDLIRRGLAYVDSLDKETIRAYRGSLTEAGKPSPYRDRSVEENLDLFARMRAGEFENGAHILRAKIDMSSPNMLMRDPPLYRIVHAHHHRTGDAWCIYPMYDYAHCLEDAIEGITHSICTLEFENNRELYDWILDHAGFEEPRPHQYEMARLALENTIMSKRKLLQLVEDNHVAGWDDPRMPTIAGLRRRGVTAASIRAFCELIGVAKANSFVDYAKLEFCIRDDLNQRAPRVMAVLDPLKVTLTNWPEDRIESRDASYWPHDVPKVGTRDVPLSREIFIERSDFMQDPPKKFFRLRPGGEVRLRYGYIIRCDEVITDADGEVVELKCSYDPDSASGGATSTRKVKGTIHWVAAEGALDAEVRLYDRLFTVANPGREAGSFLDYLNEDSLKVVQAKVEPSLSTAKDGDHFQFERQGYFVVDPDSTADMPVFNRVVTLRDSWGKATKKAKEAPAPRSTPATPPADGDESGRVRPEKRSRADVRARARERNPELAASYTRMTELGLSADDADVLSGDVATAGFFEAAVTAHGDAATVTKWMVNVVLAETKDVAIDRLALTPDALAKLIGLVDAETISTRAAKQVLEKLVAEGGEPSDWVDTLGLAQVSDSGAIAEAVASVLASNPGQLAAYRGGKEKLFGFFVGQVMKATRGQANPKVVQAALREALSQ